MDELSIKKGHTYRIVVSDLEHGRPIWVGGQGRTEADLDRFFLDLGPKKTARIRLAVLDMGKAFRNSVPTHAPPAQSLFDKFHVLRHLADAMDQVRRAEYNRVAAKERAFIKGQRDTLLSHRANLPRAGRRSLRTWLRANKRLATASLLKEAFGQLWSYRRAGWARLFFTRWRAQLKWQRLRPFERFADPFGDPHHAGRIHRLVGGNQDEPLDAQGEMGDRFGRQPGGLEVLEKFLNA